MVVDQLPRFGKRELICLLLFTCNYVLSVLRGFLFLCVLRMGYVILLWHSLSLPYNYFYKYLQISLPLELKICSSRSIDVLRHSPSLVLLWHFSTAPVKTTLRLLAMKFPFGCHSKYPSIFSM